MSDIFERIGDRFVRVVACFACSLPTKRYETSESILNACANEQCERYGLEFRADSTDARSVTDENGHNLLYNDRAGALLPSLMVKRDTMEINCVVKAKANALV